MTVPRKIRESNGGAFEHRGRLYVRVTVAPRKRTAELAPWARSLHEALERGKVVQAWVNRLRAADQTEFVEKIVELGVRAEDSETVAAVAAKVDALCAGEFERVEPARRPGAPPTYKDVATQWVRGELAVKYPDHVDRKRSAYTDLCLLRRYVFPIAGDKPIDEVGLDDYERVMHEIPGRSRRGQVRKGTRRQVAQVMRHVLVLAEYPLKLIPRNPIPESALPHKKLEVALQYLYPDEDARFLAHTPVDLGKRVLVGFLDRAGWRKEEAVGGKVEEVEEAVDDFDQTLEDVPPLTWRRLDLRHRVVAMDREKTGNPNLVPIDDDIVKALEAWRTLTPRSGDDDPVFVDQNGKLLDAYEADEFRAELKAAKVDRAELHDKTSPVRRPVRVHDTRASMVTIALANGRTEEWIRRRTNHKSSAFDRYRRVASTLRELSLGDWMPLDQAIPELAAVVTASAAAASPKNAAANAAAGSGKPTRGTAFSSAVPRGRGDWIRTSDPLTPRGENAAADGAATRDSAPLPSGPVESDAERDAVLPRGAAASGPTDAEIERGILDALARGLDGVAEALAARLEERRCRRGVQVTGLQKGK